MQWMNTTPFVEEKENMYPTIDTELHHSNNTFELTVSRDNFSSLVSSCSIVYRLK